MNRAVQARTFCLRKNAAGLAFGFSTPDMPGSKRHHFMHSPVQMR
ncbi:hypothetical protein RRSWK_06542 [Rhodopirellula sp. SWK7]|nr:hypothetical protein RRSWK_06542 [Rhodopirellula sp. SWK7]